MNLNKIWVSASLILYLLSFSICRFVLFDMHNMKDWPVVLFVFGFLVLVLALVFQRRCLTIMTIVGYSVGFMLAMLFHRDYLDPGGGTLNNAWIIWTIAFFVSVAIGAAIEIGLQKRK